MNARNYIGQKDFSVKRAIMWSHDEGDTWIGPYLNPDLPDPIVQGSMIAGDCTPVGLGVGKPLFFTNAHTTLDRANDTLMMSTSGGATWEKVLQIQHGCSEYVVDDVCCVYTCRRLIDLSLIAGTQVWCSSKTGRLGLVSTTVGPSRQTIL